MDLVLGDIGCHFLTGFQVCVAALGRGGHGQGAKSNVGVCACSVVALEPKQLEKIGAGNNLRIAGLKTCLSFLAITY